MVISYKWNHTLCDFCVWPLSLSMKFLRVICLVAYISTAFLFMAEYYFILLIYHILSIHRLIIHSSVDDYLGHFYFSAIMNNAIMHLYTDFCVDIYFHSLGYILMNGIVGSHCKTMFYTLRNSIICYNYVSVYTYLKIMFNF